LQYKQEADVPHELRRRLVRISGLLELADDEFDAVRLRQETVTEEIVTQLKQAATSQ
jgi:ppGpp synthetase/RelA/SpoT-type nucleotidyltranferase